MKNQFGIEHAFPGICSLCFKEVAEFNGSDKNGKPIISRWLPSYVSIQTLLSDGSQMSINLCADCVKSYTKKDNEKIMASEQKGWKWEIQNCLKTWSKEEKDGYEKKYSKLSIKDTSLKEISVKPIKPVIIKPIDERK